jgi:hypothetical protein
MGQEVCQVWAIMLPTMHALMGTLELDWSAASTMLEREFVGMLGFYSPIAFCGSFRGNKVFLTDLFGLCKYLG